MNDNTFTATAVLDEIEFMLNLSCVETTKGKKFFVSAHAENQSLFFEVAKDNMFDWKILPPAPGFVFDNRRRIFELIERIESEINRQGISISQVNYN